MGGKKSGRIGKGGFTGLEMSNANLCYPKPKAIVRKIKELINK